MLADMKSWEHFSYLFWLSRNRPDLAFRNIDLEKFGRYIGSYLLKEANLKMDIVQEQGKLFLVVYAQNIKSELTQKSDTSLFETTVGVVLSMVDGNINTLQFQQNGFETVLERL